MIDSLSLEISLLLIAFGVLSLVGGIALWVTMKLSGEKGSFQALMLTFIGSAVIWLIPFAGGILSLIARVFLIRQFTTAEMVDSFWMAIVSSVIGLCAVAVVFYLLLNDIVIGY